MGLYRKLIYNAGTDSVLRLSRQEQREVKDQVLEAMPACFENWCRRFDDLFSRQKQRQGFRSYLGGLLGESQRKNLTQIANNTVDGSYNGCVAKMS